MRLIDADALSEKLCKTTIFVKDGEVFQRMINDAPTVSAEAVHKPDYSYEADMVRRLKEALSAEVAIGDYPNDLISRSALMECCSNQKSKSIDNNDIARFSSAEAVEVVGCKDCKWQEECSQFVVLHKFSGVYQEISYCSHGERKGGDSE